MISRIENQLDDERHLNGAAFSQNRDAESQAKPLSEEVVAQVKKLAVAKPVVIVAAGLALGVLTGLILKRK